MNRIYTDSTMINSIAYDPTQAILEVEFKSSGHIWNYYDVPEYVWYEMNSASSIGEFFHANIKGTYTESRVG
ncbi:KTSC domain-containing protein [Paenibacillus sp. 2003]|uniref:KTSC domain-containing protein n=1 Tax=Paenibacillus TaxID=44249 RepID=UPI002855E5AF|nr:KTSC domain-containing protein [Paenibacillus sp. 2003]MDR6715636.1 hypothetical protein [Paenibacillus sp. 2003]